MNTEQKHLRIAQLDKTIARFSEVKNLPPPGGGWIYAIRTALGMSLRQLGDKLGMTPQGVKGVEQREDDGSLTLDGLREVAAVMDLQLVYGLLPREGSLDKMVEKRALELAKEIVQKTSQAMHLEDQGIDQAALQDAIEQRAAKIKWELPKAMWE